MPELLAVEEARRLTAPYHRLWAEVFRSAERSYWEIFRTNCPDEWLAMDARSRANMLHRFIVAKITKAKGVVMSKAFQFPVQILNHGEAYAIARFKLLDTDMRPNNHASETQDDLDNHMFAADAVQQLRLDGGTGDAPTILNVGYQLDRNHMAMSRLIVVNWHADDLRFWYDFEAEAGREGATVLPLPLGDLPPVATRIVSRRRRDEADSAPTAPGSNPGDPA